ncbi:heavy-metal-associated domain-containing protein [Echinicola jeungdonensis]|uniref:Heavy-metal-associated domain-containing protein n=1 Tax=Echinicola jeungdonensis TaxID=709343 RepID=A0ABV5J4Q1_9BACT|nr:heavy-metal-associated domain-containing protein [Echinicola jeungdonensis]MDN3668861.1 heavy-metal-associated domain-containing protein [Echinicola jeungdonensis]
MIKLKTNIKCGACVEAVTPKLNQLPITEWKVDLKDPDRILEVTGQVSEKEIKKALNEAGYEGQVI